MRFEEAYKDWQAGRLTQRDLYLLLDFEIGWVTNIVTFLLK